MHQGDNRPDADREMADNTLGFMRVLSLQFESSTAEAAFVNGRRDLLFRNSGNVLYGNSLRLNVTFFLDPGDLELSGFTV